MGEFGARAVLDVGCGTGSLAYWLAERFRFEGYGAELAPDSTLRFRSREELADSPTAAGFAVDDVPDAPRPTGT